MFKESNQICRFFGKGKVCKYRDSCRFKHTILNNSTEDSPQQHHEVLSDSATENLAGQKNNSLSAEKNQSCQNEVSTVSSADTSKAICHNYSRFGNCRYGVRCRYQHVAREVHSLSESTEDPAKPKSYVLKKDLVKHGAEDYSLAEISATYRKICKWFLKDGNCRYGDSCTFKHSSLKTADDEDKTDQVDQSNITDFQKTTNLAKSSRKSEKCKGRKVCPYFKNGDCSWGRRCRFWHPHIMEDVNHDFQLDDIDDKTADNISQNVENVSPAISKKQMKLKPVIQKEILRKDDATKEALEKLRQVEIDQMKKRFPNEKFAIVTDTNTEFSMKIKFCPTDPDWPFAVKVFELLVSVPEHYPEQMFSVVLPEQDLPETVRRYIEMSIKECLYEKQKLQEKHGTLELHFRPFVRWLDRSIQEIVTEGLRQLKRELIAKEAGFQFISARELQAVYHTKHHTDKSESADTEKQVADEDDDTAADEDGVTVTKSSSEEKSVSALIDPEKKGTEIQLRNLQLNNVSTLHFESIHIIIQCCRCRHKCEFTTPAHRVNSVSCAKCNVTQVLVFRPSIIHQLSAVMGYLDLDNCSPFDLILQESTADIGCLNCCKDNKKKGMSVGQLFDTWCHFCHQKLSIATENVKFTQLQPSAIKTDEKQVHKIEVARIRKLKDPVIQEGKPLPEFGTCKHYKKSFRWFRFPCCGMVYPCDLCHNESELDHEMKFANRIICGFCCKEQPYSPEKPCVLCKQMTTKQKSCHWEGGSGCRDKIKMSKNDCQKYGNMNKTVSRHSQNMKDQSNKKKTKLRHA